MNSAASSVPSASNTASGNIAANATVQTFMRSYAANRKRTLGLLDTIEQLPNPAEALAWRPAPGRAYIAWQLMHIGVTEEIFATERLSPGKQAASCRPVAALPWRQHSGRRRATPAEIREVLSSGREQLLATLAGYTDDQLGEIPPALAERKWTVQDVLHVLGWHESHHQGQAHLTLNLYRNR